MNELAQADQDTPRRDFQALDGELLLIAELAREVKDLAYDKVDGLMGQVPQEDCDKTTEPSVGTSVLDSSMHSSQKLRNELVDIRRALERL